MDLRKQQYLRYSAHVLVALALLIYLISANYIFCCLLKVDGEAQICSINIPEETGNIIYAIDIVEKHQFDWKEVITIRGWSFIEGEDACNSSTYIVIKTETERYIFDTRMETKPGITQHFEDMQLNLDESGFYSNIPLERIPDGKHQIGIMISRNDADSTSYILTNTYIIKKGKYIEIERK